MGAAAVTLAGCAGGGASREEFEADVQETRDRVDFAMESLSRARDPDDLFNRMEDSAEAIDAAADDLDEAGAPD